MGESLFPNLTNVLGEELGPSVRSNWNYNWDWPLLTVVKIQNKRFGLFDSNDRYKPTRLKLTDLTKENLCLEPQTEKHMEDYKSISRHVEELGLGGGHNEVPGKMKVKQDCTYAMCRMTLMKEFVRDEDCKNLWDKRIELQQEFVDGLKMKSGEKLAFVVQRFYNKEKVQVLGEVSFGGFFGIKAFSFVNVSYKNQNSGIKSFILPEHKTFGLVLQEMELYGNTLSFAPVIFQVSNTVVSCASMGALKLTTLAQDMIGELERNVDVWQSLAGCGHLLPKLAVVLEEGCPLIQLEDTLDRILDGDIQPEGAGASFEDLVSSASREQIEALRLLVCALADLPENIPAALVKSGLETLDHIMKIMEHLNTGAAEVPESLVRPLLEKEELSWVGSFLKSGHYMYKPKSARDNRPPAQLEALCISVRGISAMLRAEQKP